MQNSPSGQVGKSSNGLDENIAALVAYVSLLGTFIWLIFSVALLIA